MTKKRSRNLIIFLSIILVVGILASFVSFTYPFAVKGNYYSYSSFINELVLGADISDGVIITYRADLPEGEQADVYDNYMNNTLLGIEEILTKAGYRDNSVVRKGENEIHVSVGNIEDYEDRQSVLSLIGNPQKLRFSKESSGSTTAETDIAGKYVKHVEVKEQAGNGITLYYVDIQLDSTGTTKLAELSETIVKDSGTLYMYLGKTAISSNSLEQAITDGHLTMYSEENFVDKQTTQSYVNNIKTGLLDLDLTQLESSAISANMGNRIKLWITIALVVLILASFVFMVVKFRELGGVAIFTLLYYVVIGLGLLQSIPFMHINFAGVLALGLCYIIAFDALFTICEKAKGEYAKGKKLHTCFKLAQKNSLWQILVSNILLFGAGVICALMPNGLLQSFGMVTFVLSLANIFVSLVWFRVMLKLYSAQNFYKGEKCNFKLEEGAKNVK